MAPVKPSEDTINPAVLKSALILVAAAFGVAFWWSAGFSAAAVLLSLWLPGAQRDRDRPEPAAAKQVSEVAQ